MMTIEKRVARALAAGIAMLLCIVGFGYFYFTLKNRQLDLEKVIEQLQLEQEQMRVSSLVQPQSQEHAMTSHEIWRPIQEKIKDSVVQVLSQFSEIDICQPFKTPSQYAAYGSGFFINEEGEIVTNAHVVEKAKVVWVHIPSFGKRLIDAEIVSIAPERDLALLRLKKDGLELIQSELGQVPYLELGDSDLVRRADEVMALGYPLMQHALKSTTGVISGRESNLIQMSAAINPGSSGGPLLDIYGHVVGINTCGVVEAQNVGYIIPINDLKLILADMRKEKILHRPLLGILCNNATEALVDYLGNPRPGGCYIVEIIKNSPLARAGVKRGDMLYEINGYPVDMFGDMNVPWSEDKISVFDFVSRLSLGDKVKLVLYRNGKKMNTTVTFAQFEQPQVRKVFPAFEHIDYEVIGGMVVMQLTLNHIAAMVKYAPGLTMYAEYKNQNEPMLVVAHVFQTSYLARMQVQIEGATINEVNGVPVRTLEEFRKAVKKASGAEFLTLRIADNIVHITDHVLVVLPMDKILEEEPLLAHDFCYPLTDLAKELIKSWDEAKQVNQAISDTEKKHA